MFVYLFALDPSSCKWVMKTSNEISDVYISIFPMHKIGSGNPFPKCQ